MKLILSSDDRTVGVQGYAGSGKTTMLNRARALLEKRGWEVRGLAPSASAARTLSSEAGIGTETLQRFLARYGGVAAGRMTAKGEREMRAAFAKTVLIVDEGSLASTVQARDLLRIANALRIPRVVLVGDEKQLDAVDAGKPFAQLQAAGMKTALMDQIMRQRDPALKDAVEASLAGDIAHAFEKLGDNVAEVNPDNLAGAAAARWLALPPEAREHTGLMAPSHALREGINEDGRILDMNAGDPQLRHMDRAWASTVHAFQGRTVDNVIAAIEANHPNLTNRKMLYVEISRARDRAELVTDDKAALREQIQALTGERIAALEAVGEAKAKAPEAAKAGGMDAEIGGERSAGRTMEPEKTPAPKSVDRDLGL